MKKFIILLLFFGSLSCCPTQATDQDITDGLLQHGVLVRVWSSAVSGGQNVGHTSLQTTHDYISFWPSEEGSTATGYFNTLEEDYIDEEGRDPEITIFLKNPNTESTNLIHQDFEFLKTLLGQGKLTWVLNGHGQKLKEEFTQTHYDLHCRGVSAFKTDSHAFGMYDNWAFNCSSIVYNLLRNRQYLSTDPLANISGINTCMAPDQVAQACSLSFLRTTSGENYRYLCEEEMKRRGVTSLLSFQERYIGYYVFKTVDKKVTYNANFLDLAAEKLKVINEQGFGIQLLEMLSSLGLSELLSPAIGGQPKK